MISLRLPLLALLTAVAFRPLTAQETSNNRVAPPLEKLLIVKLRLELADSLKDEKIINNPESLRVCREICGQVAFYVYLTRSVPDDERVFEEPGVPPSVNSSLEYFVTLFHPRNGPPLRKNSSPIYNEVLQDPLGILQTLEKSVAQGAGVPEDLFSGELRTLLPGYAEFKGSGADLLKRYREDVKGFNAWVETFLAQRRA